MRSPGIGHDCLCMYPRASARIAESEVEPAVLVSSRSTQSKMGQTLSEPETTKHTSYGEDDRLLFAVSEMQGWRLSESSFCRQLKAKKEAGGQSEYGRERQPAMHTVREGQNVQRISYGTCLVQAQEGKNAKARS